MDFAVSTLSIGFMFGKLFNIFEFLRAPQESEMCQILL